MDPVLVPYARVLTPPEAEPFTLAQAKLWCRVDSDDTSQDDVLELLIAAVRERCESLTGRALVQRRAELRLDKFPAKQVIELPFAPLIAVEYVKYIDTAGSLQTMEGSPTQWIEDIGSENAPGRIQPLAGASWPGTQDTIAAVRIGFQCGYAPPEGSPIDHGGNVPGTLMLWMRARLASYYENREDVIVGRTFQPMPRDHIDGLLDGQKVNLGFA